MTATALWLIGIIAFDIGFVIGAAWANRPRDPEPAPSDIDWENAG